MPKSLEKSIDTFNREIVPGDWVAYTTYRTYCAGFVVGFTKKGNPRVLRYEPSLKRFQKLPSAAGVHNGVVKIEPLTDQVPN